MPGGSELRRLKGVAPRELGQAGGKKLGYVKNEGE